MAKKFYVVWVGRLPGVYASWGECKEQVEGFTGAKYKSFATEVEAQRAYSGSPLPSSLGWGLIILYSRALLWMVPRPEIRECVSTEG